MKEDLVEHISHNKWLFKVQPNPMTACSRNENNHVKYKNIAKLYFLALKHTRSLRKAKETLFSYERNRRKYQGDFPISKIAKVSGRYYRDISLPGYPSKALTNEYIQTVNRINGLGMNKGLMVMYFAITNKCALQCQHCYEWDQINQPDALSAEQIIDIIIRFQQNSLGVLFLEGGEPLQRIKDLYKILPKISNDTDCWIITSGHLMNDAKARKLKKSGLTGVMVSIDHFDESAHNAFRGHQRSFEWGVNAIISSNNAGLVTALSLCATKEFTNKSNLIQYMEFAKGLGVTYVQILEPRDTGRYTHQEISLSAEQLQILDQIYVKYNSGHDFLNYPFITMPSYHQRRIGCYGAGQRYLFIDSKGKAHACPFCRKEIGDTFQLIPDDIKKLATGIGCHQFSMADNLLLKSRKKLHSIQ